MNNILKIDNISKSFKIKQTFGKSQSFFAVKNINIELEKGQCLGLVGESGCGKSTLARMVVGLMKPSSGNIFIDNLALYAKDDHNFSAKVQMVFQDPFSSLNPRKSVGKSISEPLYLNNPNLTKQELKEITIANMESVGLDALHYGRFPHEFSGGQRQRIALARALITKPQIIVCDEPVSALDVSVQAQVLNLMRDFQEKLNLSYIFISHDLHVVAYMSHEIAIMYFGQIVEKSKKENIFKNPSHPYTKALLEAAPNFSQHHRNFAGLQGEPPNPLAVNNGCAFKFRCKYVKEICHECEPQLNEIRAEHFVACHFPLT